MLESITFPDNNTSNKNIQIFLKSCGFPYSYSNKEKLLERINIYKNIVEFPWRIDQFNVISSFIEQKYRYYVVNGIFGCGKTTMLLGIYIISILKKLYKPRDALFISFNVCIKNELEQKLKFMGISSKTKVRTFDSIIYEICKIYNYPYLDLPNYEGKRKFVYKICKEILNNVSEKRILSINPTFIFIDECQDLESQTMIIFETFFSQSQIIFTGDVFQSIQKEPKESLLWKLLNNTTYNISKYCMKETPRVPQKILKSLKTSLQNYYPELSGDIEEWKSDNIYDSNIKWKQFDNYSKIFKEIQTFLENYEHKKCMILTFSSAITVKGNMGDLARIRRFLLEKNIDVIKTFVVITLVSVSKILILIPAPIIDCI